MVNTNKVKARIVELGFTQGDVAKALGISQPTLSQRISNIKAMTLTDAEELGAYLQLDVSEYPAYFFYDPVTQRNNPNPEIVAERNMP